MHTIKLLLTYYLNISVQAANLLDCRIESKLFSPELECSTLEAVLRGTGGGFVGTVHPCAPFVSVGVPCKDAGGWAACIEQTCLTQTLLCTRLPALCHRQRRPTPRRVDRAVIGRHLSRTPIRTSLRTVQGTRVCRKFIVLNDTANLFLELQSAFGSFKA